MNSTKMNHRALAQPDSSWSRKRSVTIEKRIMITSEVERMVLMAEA